MYLESQIIYSLKTIISLESDEVTREKRMDILEWISDEEFQKILEEREHIDYPR